MSGNFIKNNKTKSNLLLVIVVVTLFAVVAIMFSIDGICKIKKNTYVDDSVFDMSTIDFDHKQNAYLNGDWEFYYNTLLVTDNVQNPQMTEVLKVPSSWNDMFNSENPLPKGGYGSYRCYIKNAQTKESLKLYIPNIACAYRVFINGSIVASSGTVSKEPSEVFTTAKASTIPFTFGDNDEYEIVIEVASNNYSGLYMAPVVANYEHDNTYVEDMTAIRLCFLGIVFFVCILSFTLRMFINKKLYSNWLPFLLFILFLRMSITTEVYSITQSTYGNISYEQMSLFIFAFTFVIKLLSLIYLFRCLDFHISIKTVILLCTSFFAISMSAIIFPQFIFNQYYFILYQMFSIVIDLYIFNKLCIEVVNKTEFSLLYLISYMLIVSGLTIDSFYVNGLITIRCSAYLSFCIFLFVMLTIIIHSFRIRKLYYYALQTQQLKAEVENLNNSIMLSQIQPHFLYNALNTIKSLIRKNPPLAEKAIIDFSLYLRGNMDSLSQTEPILFSEELQHVKYYCNIEQLRFSDKLDIYYDIDVDSFYVPTLSIQPIVENAIKHGVTKRPEGGSVTISTYEDEKNYYIIVEDDGIGFNVDEGLNKSDSNRSHVGLQNIISRFEKIMDGCVNIESKVGEGTKVTVILPKASNTKALEINKIYEVRGINI